MAWRGSSRLPSHNARNAAVRRLCRPHQASSDGDVAVGEEAGEDHSRQGPPRKRNNRAGSPRMCAVDGHGRHNDVANKTPRGVPRETRVRDRIRREKPPPGHHEMETILREIDAGGVAGVAAAGVPVARAAGQIPADRARHRRLPE